MTAAGPLPTFRRMTKTAHHALPLALSWRRAAIVAAGVVGFALLTALGAQAALPLPGTPVPLTLQTLVVLLAGAALGPRWGMLSMAFYVLLGSVGYHVFALGNWGFATIAGPTAGYLLGFLLAQPAVGRLTRTGRRDDVLLALLAGHAIIFACGLAWLALWAGADLQTTLAWGLWPFVPGMLLKSAAALAIAPVLVKRLRPKFEP